MGVRTVPHGLSVSVVRTVSDCAVLLLDVRHEAALILGAAMALVALLLQLETDPTASRTRQVGARVGLPFEHSCFVIVTCRLQQASTAMQRSSCQHH